MDLFSVNFYIWFYVQATSFSCLWVSGFPSIIGLKNYLFPIEWPRNPCQNHLTIYVRFYFWTLFYSIRLCVSLVWYHAI